jgi:hypothetical protein
MDAIACDWICRSLTNPSWTRFNVLAIPANGGFLIPSFAGIDVVLKWPHDETVTQDPLLGPGQHWVPWPLRSLLPKSATAGTSCARGVPYKETGAPVAAGTKGVRRNISSGRKARGSASDDFERAERRRREGV